MKKPNIVYILADDMGYGDISCLNPESKIHTPNLDRLAQEGLSCRDAHSSSAVCTPSRYSILTGRYNWRSVLKEGVTWGYSGPIIERGRITVASFLRQHGYATGCIGKWHLGWDWKRSGPGEDDIDFHQPIDNGPLSVGFDYFFGISASLDMPPYVYVENDRVTAVPDRIVPARYGEELPNEVPGGEPSRIVGSPQIRYGKEFWREGPIAPDFDHADVLPRLTQRAEAFIEEKSRGDAPFFLYFALTAPHTPILPAPEFRGRSGTNEYGDFCLHLDAVVGRVLAALERNGVADDTIVIFTSDNGCSPMADFEELAACGHFPSYVFRGHKADIYEGGHRIPLLVRWPNGICAGTVCHETVCLSDLLATCAEILGVTLPDNAGEDSVSNLPAWQGKMLDRPLREMTVHHSLDGSFSIRVGRWKLEMCPGSGGWSSPMPGPECEGLPPIQLYDLSSDIGEQVNVADEHPEVVSRLRDMLTACVVRGRSTPGAPLENSGGHVWPQLWWMS